MKKNLLVTLILLSATIFSNAQTEGYIHVGYSNVILSKSNYSSGAYLGGGAKFGQIFGAGFNLEYRNLNAHKDYQHMVGSIDLRAHHDIYYLSLQPGYSFLNREIGGVDVKGGFSGVAMIGAKLKFADVAIGYQTSATKVGNLKPEYDGGFRINVGIGINSL